MKNIEGVEFGDKVTITQKLKRVTGSEPRAVNVYYRRWEASEIKPIAGCVFIGYRTLSNGNISYDEYHQYSAREHFQAAAVVIGSGVNPIYVPLDGVEHETS